MISIFRSATADADVATGTWADGRLGVFRGSRTGPHDYGALVFGQKATGEAGPFTDYKPLVKEIAGFFRSKMPPVSAAETLEIHAFMAAADESKAKGGLPIAVADVLAKGQRDAVLRLASLPSAGKP